jgi:hypothetical protein
MSLENTLLQLFCLVVYGLLLLLLLLLRVGADKSLARPGRKEATATKLGIYLAYSHEAQYTS